jgi:multidrug efflux pump subunit AcrB/outer membrane protein TolC
VLFVIIVIGGLSSYSKLPREAAPDIAIPIVIISTPYFGVSPADIETLVTQPLEKELKGLRDLKVMTSTSAESVSLVTLEFEPEIDIEDALQKVRDKVDKAKPELPPDAEDPEIIEVNASDWPVLIANVSANMDPVRLKELAEDIKDDIEKVPGVLRVDLTGGVEREIQVLADPAALRHHKVSLNQLIGTLQKENINLPGGNVDMGPMTYTVRVPGEFESVTEIEDLVVKAPMGNPVYVRDVARIVDTYKSRETFSRLTTWQEVEGERVPVTRTNVSLAVVKRAGENIIEIADEAKKVIAEHEQTTSGIKIQVINDMSEVIKMRVHELENNIITGLLLVLLTLLFFMGGFRNALFVAISVPLSMLISFMVLSALGITLNMVVLFSLVLALGMIVDNAIVIVENIYRHASEGKDRVTAALDGTTEVGWPVIASTATTVGAFFPMLFWPGVMGEFMGYLPLTVIITLLSSLFVALVINPTLCAVFLKVDDSKTYNENEVPDNFIYRWYRSSLEWALNWRVTVMVLATAALFGSIIGWGATAAGVEFFPKTTPDKFEVSIEMPDGTNLETTRGVMERIATNLDTHPDLTEAWILDGGIKGGQSMGASGRAEHYGKITVDLVPVEEQQENPSVWMDELRKVFAEIPGASIVINTESMGPPSGKAVNIEIVGEDLEVMSGIARDVKDQVRGIPGIMDLTDDIELSRPEIHVIVDRERAAVAGVDTRGIAQTVRTAINGTEATVFREGDDEYDIMVKLPEEDRQDLEDIRNLTVVNRDEFHIPLTEVALVQVRGGAGSIRHKDQDRVVTVSANAADGYLPAKLLAEVQRRVSENVNVPSGYTVRYTGENEDQKEAQDFMVSALLAALFIISLILVTQFNSVMQPLIIVGSVMLSLIGVFLSLIISGAPFGVIMTGIAIISLAGIVVNNSIVLIDYINQLRERGFDKREAVVTAGLVRLRPVMLTAVTTVLGLVPIVIGVSIDFVNTKIAVGGQSVEMWGPMADAVTAGLMVATVLTLIVVPVLYSLFDDIGDFIRRLFRLDKGDTKKAAAAASVMIALLSFVPVVVQAQEPADSPDGVVTDTAEADDSGRFSRPEDVEGDTRLRAEDALETLDVPSERTLTYDQALEAVRNDNLDVLSAENQIEIADTFIRQAYSTLFPSFQAGGTVTVNQQEIALELGGDPSQLPPGAPAPEPAIVQPKWDYRWNVSASLNLNFRAISLIQQAYLQKSLATNSVDVVREQLELAVAQTYFGLLTLRQVLAIANEQYESARTMLNATQARVDAGTANRFELTRAKLRVAQTETEVERARIEFIKVRESLAQLLQQDANFDVAEPTVEDLKQTAAQLQQKAKENRTLVAVAKQQVDLADEQVDEMFFRYLPTFGTTFTVFGARETVFQPGDPQWVLTFNANWLLWDGGSREAEWRRLEAQRVGVDLDRRKRETQLETDIDVAWADYQSSLTQLESARTQAELAEEALRQAQVAYKYGAATQLDVITAEDSVRTARISLVQTKLGVELAQQNLRNLAGI